MPNLNQIKEICSKYDITPSKSKGQNFLIDQNIVKKIIDAAEIKKDETVVEVGPGVGVLTEDLIKAAKKVVAVEVDKKILEFLRVQFLAEKKLEIIGEDILRLNKKEAGLNNFKYKVVSNLPYNITSKFLRLSLEQEPKPSEMILMVQKEVAKRIVAKAGDMSLLSLSCQFYSQPEILFFVSRNSFWPIPDVDSAVIKLKLFSNLDEKIDESTLFKIARMGFSSKRKQLHNNFSAGLKINSEKAKEIITGEGFDEKVRAQDLSVIDWIKLTQGLKKSKIL